jgi:anti-sigma factor ChrR (cupin superfamily)
LQEIVAVDEHVAICVDCRAELQVLREVASEMPHALSGPKPHPRVKDKLMAAISRAPGKPEQPQEGVFVYRDYGWKKTPYPGVDYQVLYMDRDTQMVTTMLKLEPGSTYPAHEHAGTEQSYVIEGSCYIGNVALRKGEYAYAVAGTEHGTLHSNEGCLLLVVSSTRDRLKEVHI